MRQVKKIVQMIFSLGILAPVLMGCSDSLSGKLEERPLNDLYNEAMDAMEKGTYVKAAELFLEVERQHPYSEWSTRAQLLAGYCYFQAKKYDDAIENFNVFLQLHPGHEQVAYAYYMLGICYYEQIPIIERDQKTTAQALEAFAEVVQRFPHTSYGKDAKAKIAFIKDHLAAKEMEVGRFYQHQGSHLSAVNRFKNVVDQFQTSTHVPEALHRLVECYLALGIKDQAQKTAAVLGHNYPGSTWYSDSYALMKDVMPSALLPSLKSTMPTSQPMAKGQAPRFDPALPPSLSPSVPPSQVPSFKKPQPR